MLLSRSSGRSLLGSRHRCLKTRPLSATFSTSSVYRSYDDTIDNLRIGKHTRVIFQGFTGKQATANARDSIAWGTQIVGGVKPGGSGEHLGLPVFPSVKEAKEQVNPDATAIYVAAHQAPGAIEEAIEAEIPLIVAVAEHIPLHDILRIHSMLQTQSKSRLVGANAPGIISAIGRCRIGFQPLSCFTPGHVGIAAKSGTLSYETVGSLTRAGVGQSLSISVGGDVVAGTNFIDALRVFETDEDTEGIILVGELGGTSEEEAAEWIQDYRRRAKNPKPIAAVIGGFQAPPGRVMGHAGAWTGIGEGTSESKYKALENAGVTMVDHPAKFGNVMKELLSSRASIRALSERNDSGPALNTSSSDPNEMPSASSGASATRKGNRNSSPTANQRRSFHTHRFPLRPQPPSLQSFSPHGTRSLHISTGQAARLLLSYDIPISPTPSPIPSSSQLVGITVDRTARQPCILASPTTSPSQLDRRVKRIPFDYRTGPSQAHLLSALEHLQLDAAPPQAKTSTINLIRNLWDLYREKEAVSLTVSISLSDCEDHIRIFDPSFTFDDAAFRSCKRQKDIHDLRDPSSIPQSELEAEKHGIVYIPLPSPTFTSGSTSAATQTSPNATPPEPKNLIGTLVNGAGLAMNTNDVLAARLLHPSDPSLPPTTSANFLDTGGKATAETISTSFKLILSDPRVAVVFVNIFGGLTLCDMIAEGIILAFKEVGVRKPVVVRLRGTNEEMGRRILEGAGLPIRAFDGFEEAVGECGRLVGEVAREG